MLCKKMYLTIYLQQNLSHERFKEKDFEKHILRSTDPDLHSNKNSYHVM